MAPAPKPFDLDQRLRAADPAAEAVDELEHLSLAMVREVIAGMAPHRPRLPRRGRGAIVGAVVAILLGVPAAYAGSRLFAAETGQYGAPGMTENDTSQFIDVCAADFPAYLHSLPTPSDPPPPGWTWSRVADRLAIRIHDESATDCAGPGSVMQQTGLGSRFYLFALERWEHAGITAHRAGREDAAKQDLRMAALMMQRLDELRIWGDDGWQRVHQALLTADWPAVEYDLKVNGDPDIAP